MKLSIVAIGGKMPSWVQDGYKEYARRLPRELLPVLIELPLATRSKATSVSKLKQLEAKQILDVIPDKSYVVALDVLGKAQSTENLAKKMGDWQMNGRDVTLLIGGPDGLDASILARSDEKWSLSALTLPHPLVRVVLIEQLYRAYTILTNHPYHK